MKKTKKKAFVAVSFTWTAKALNVHCIPSVV